jgi:hypothetical protein
MSNQQGFVMGMSSAERSARYRAKDVDAYRAKKAEYARSPEERKKRTEYMRVWREQNRERHNELARQSRTRHRTACNERSRLAHYVTKYGITWDEKQAMVIAQGNKCLICLETFKSSRATHVDHCHASGAVRGILCHVCNTKLGWYEAFRDRIKDYTA